MPTSSTSSSEPTWRSTLAAALSLAGALLIIDIAWGRLAPLVESRVERGELVGVYNLARQARPDLLILGSSRAFNNYDASELGPATFNAGLNGQGMALARIMLSLTPQKGGMIIIDPMFFEEERSRLASAHHLAGTNAVIDEVLALGGWRERVKLRSSLYTHAHSLIPSLANLGAKPDNWAERQGRLPRPKSIPSPGGQSQLMPEPWWWEQMDKLLDDARARGSEVVVVISPCANRSYDLFFDTVALRYKGKVRLIDERAALPRTPEFFADTMHLNAEGSRTWTARLRSRLSAPLSP